MSERIDAIINREASVRFSQRKGYTEVSKIIQKDGMSDELRNSLWTILDVFLWRKEGFVWLYSGTPRIEAFSAALWFEFLKLPLDTRPQNHSGDVNGAAVVAFIRKQFFSATWFEVYDFLEWTLRNVGDRKMIQRINDVLQTELAGYRYVGDTFTDVTNDGEIASLQEALADSDFPGVQAHLSAALRLLSDRKTPDYRNSIKESISAVESFAQTITKDPKATLGQALGVLEKKGTIHNALKQSFASLYGYTSDQGGIRHAMLTEPNLDADDAKFFLLSCTSFINYLKSKL